MQDDEKNAQIPLNVKKFISYVNKTIRHNLRDFDEKQERRKANELLPDDGDLSDAPSMQEKLEAIILETGAYPFMRSDGKGEPMLVYRADLAEAMEELAPKEIDFIIKHFQEGMPVAMYAVEEGISSSMAFRRKKAILNRLWESITRRMNQNECKSKTHEEKNGEQAQAYPHKRGGL